MMSQNKFQVIEGGRVKSSAVLTAAEIKEAYGQWTRADKPLGLGYLAFKNGVSQNFLAHEFMDIACQVAWSGGLKAGRESLWQAKKA